MKTRAASKRQRVQVTHRVLHITDLVGSIMPFMDSLSLHNLARAASSVQLRSELQQELKERSPLRFPVDIDVRHEGRALGCDVRTNLLESNPRSAVKDTGM